MEEIVFDYFEAEDETGDTELVKDDELGSNSWIFDLFNL